MARQLRLRPTGRPDRSDDNPDSDHVTGGQSVRAKGFRCGAARVQRVRGMIKLRAAVVSATVLTRDRQRLSSGHEQYKARSVVRPRVDRVMTVARASSIGTAAGLSKGGLLIEGKLPFACLLLFRRGVLPSKPRPLVNVNLLRKTSCSRSPKIGHLKRQRPFSRSL